MCGKIKADAILKSYYYQGPSPPAAPAKGQSAMEGMVLFLYFLFYYVRDTLRCFFFVSRIFPFASRAVKTVGEPCASSIDIEKGSRVHL